MAMLPQRINQLSAVQVVALQHNRLTGLPAELSSMSHVVVLNLAFNSISHLPEGNRLTVCSHAGIACDYCVI